MEMVLHRFDVPLRHVFAIAYGATDVHHTVIVELRDGGFSGYGEAGQSGYYRVTTEQTGETLEAARGEIESASWDDPAEFWERMQPVLGGASFAQCALDLAAHDLWGKRKGRAVWDLWGLSTDHCPATDYTIGLDPVEKMVAKMREFPDWPIYKVKLPAEGGLSILRELRKHTEATFRIDANMSWTVEQTLRNAREMKAMGVELIEQPLPADDWEGHRRVYEGSVLPIIADESCIAEGDVARCEGHFHGVNVKLVKAGGLTPGRRMVLDAKRRGLKAMVGCMTETTVGISAIAQLLPLLDYVDMDGALLLAGDVASGVRIETGRVIYPDVPGCGVTLLGGAAPDEV